MATVALSKLLKRPIKFVADRIESFVTDIHARDHRVKAKIGVKNDGSITAWEIDDLTGIGPLLGLSAHVGHRGEPDRQSHRRAVYLPELPRPRPRGVPEQERHVPVPRGRPSDRDRGDGGTGRACRRQIGMDPLEIRRRNLIPDDAHPSSGPSGHQVRGAVAPRMPRHLDAMMNYAGLRAEQKRLRAQGIYRGIGFASFVE
jgi:carbon-monoxide dehydrogenase large subunit